MARYLIGDEGFKENDVNQDSNDMNEIEKEVQNLHDGDEPQHVLKFKAWKSEKNVEKDEEKKAQIAQHIV